MVDGLFYGVLCTAAVAIGSEPKASSGSSSTLRLRSRLQWGKRAETAALSHVAATQKPTGGRAGAGAYGTLVGALRAFYGKGMRRTMGVWRRLRGLRSPFAARPERPRRWRPGSWDARRPASSKGGKWRRRRRMSRQRRV